MKKKKIFSLVVALALVGAVAVGATLAYFTDSHTAKNVITMGNVDIDLDEPNFDPTPEGEEKDNKIEDITPGEEITKDPTITVADDSEDAYLRAKIEITGLGDEQKAELLKGINVDADHWYLGEDGYYYYQSIVKAKDVVVLFDKVKIPERWGNEVADLTFEIIVSAEAIQADNFNPARVDNAENGKICAWLYSDGTAITAETYVAPTVSGGDI